MIQVTLEVGTQKGTDLYEIKSAFIEPKEVHDNFNNLLVDGQSFPTVEKIKEHVLKIVKSLICDNLEIIISII